MGNPTVPDLALELDDLDLDLGCDPVARQRPTKPVQKEYIPRDGERFIPVSGYDSFVTGEDGTGARGNVPSRAGRRQS